jgi:glyoxalase-like protein
VSWAIHDCDLDRRVAASRERGFDPGLVLPMSRRAPAGLIEWRLTLRSEPGGDGLVPFVIDWGGTPSPATTSVGGCTLRSLRAEHPDPAAIAAMLDALGVRLEVGHGTAPLLAARIATPRGEIELR